MHFGIRKAVTCCVARVRQHGATRTTRSKARSISASVVLSHKQQKAVHTFFFINDSLIVFARALCWNHYSSVIARKTLSTRFRVKVIYIKSEIYGRTKMNIIGNGHVWIWANRHSMSCVSCRDVTWQAKWNLGLSEWVEFNAPPDTTISIVSHHSHVTDWQSNHGKVRPSRAVHSAPFDLHCQ